MQTFIVKTPVWGATGEHAGVYFDKGEARVSTGSDKSDSALRYFYEAGYTIVGIDGEPPAPGAVEAALGLPAPDSEGAEQARRDAAEAAELKAERDRLKGAEDLESLRKEVADLRQAAADRAAKQAEADAEAQVAAEKAAADADAADDAEPVGGDADPVVTKKKGGAK